jgi:hypothetical protein
MTPPTIYAYIKQEEASFQTDEIQLGSNWFWNMRKHVELIFHLKNGIFYTGENNWLRAFKNIMEPMLNLAYWTEDLEVKDVVFYIKNNRVLSFFLKKYHEEVYAKENDLDMMFDEITESDLDYGGVVVQKAKGRPEVLALNSVAFCDQTDILSNPRAFKHHFSPDALRKMSKKGWGDKANGATITLDELATLANSEKEPAGTLGGKANRVTGKSVEVYITSGPLPEHYLLDNDNMEDWYDQVQIIAFYTDKNKKREGVTLYRKKDDGENLRFHTSKKVHGRALGRGVGESILPDQVWTNFLEIHKMDMLAAAAKVPLVTDDPTYTQKNKVQEMETLEVTIIEEGKTIKQIPTAATANIQLYEAAINEWYLHAQLVGSAQDPLLGKEESAGSTFRGQERLVSQGRGIHDRRRGQRAKFIEQLYRDWIVPDMVKGILSGTEFIATLTADEMTWVVDQLATDYANRRVVETTIEALEQGKPVPLAEDHDALFNTFKELFAKAGNQHLLEILEGEFKDVDIRIGINIAGKQKDLVGLSDKVLSIIQFAMSNYPAFQQAMQNPGLAKAFNDVLEFGGMSQVDFAGLTTQVPPQPMLAGPQPGPGQPQAPAQPLALSGPPQV